MSKQNHFNEHPAPLQDLMRLPPTPLTVHRAQTQLRVNARRKLEDAHLGRALDALEMTSK
jgi:hypothetical protein